MANYESVTRSNYFHVKDEDAFSKFMDTVSGDDMHCWSDKDEDGNTLHAFGCDGSIYGVPNGAKDNDFDLFLSELQKHIAPEDAVILMESGHEKLRYVTGFATVITSGGIETISIDELAISKAREMLKILNIAPKWITKETDIMAYDAWTEGYLKAKQSKANKFDPNISIRFERVGNWIVSAKVLGGYKTVICIYYKKTLMEHYKTEQITESQKAFNNAFQRVIDLAKKWN